MLRLFLFSIVSMAYCQWNWNPFAAWQKPNWQQQQWQGQQAFAARQQQTGAGNRLHDIYGVPGSRNANQKLRTCCRGLKNADVECRRRYCDFNALRPDTVLGFMAQCAPKGPTVGQMWDCASSRADHTACCQQQGVLPACQVYCETTNGVPSDYLKYIVCLSQFDKIRSCFQQYLEIHPNINGET